MSEVLHFEEVGACQMCVNCVEDNHPYYYCLENNDNFGSEKSHINCKYFEYLEDDEDDEDDFDITEPIECPQCGSDALWGGCNYECESCGWCGLLDED